MVQQVAEMARAAMNGEEFSQSDEFDWVEDLSELMDKFEVQFEALQIVENERGELFIRDPSSERDFAVRLSLLDEMAEQVAESEVDWRRSDNVKSGTETAQRTYVD